MHDLTGRNKNKTKKQRPNEGSNSESSDYENNALSAWPLTHINTSVILRS